MAIQSIASLDRTYGTPTRRVILDCCSYTVITAVHDAETQKYCSELVGGYHTWTPSMSETYHPSRWDIGVSRQISGNREPILYPEDFATLRDFVLVSPFGNYFVEKDPYYENESLLLEQRQEGFRRLLQSNNYEEDYFYDDPRTYRQ
jgi:type IV secretory pathway TraG/TraD family ATPase VirD4